jgi:hypothetical protein
MHACNPTTQEVEIWEDCDPGKKLMCPYLKTKLGMAAQACKSSYTGGRRRRIMFQDQPQAKSIRHYLKNKFKQKWPESGSSGRALPACKSEALSSKVQYHKKKKKLLVTILNDEDHKNQS